VEFPTAAPAFFHPTDGKKYLFQEELPNLIAARYWRCAWINEALTASSGDARAAKAMAQGQLRKYQQLPGVERKVNVEEYETQFAALAKSRGQQPLETEFEIECGLFTASAEGN
jgi:hypothetical protein